MKGALRYKVCEYRKISLNTWFELCFDYATLSQGWQGSKSALCTSLLLCLRKYRWDCLLELSGRIIIDFRMFGGRCRQRFVEYWETSQKLNGMLVCDLACQRFYLLHSFTLSVGFPVTRTYSATCHSCGACTLVTTDRPSHCVSKALFTRKWWIILQWIYDYQHNVFLLVLTGIKPYKSHW